VAFFARRSKPEDCIDRISRCADELRDLMQMLDATTNTDGYATDWDDNRACARDHLTEALSSFKRALNALMVSNREPTWGGRGATVETQRKHIVALEAELTRLHEALASARARAGTAESELAQLVAGRSPIGDETAGKVRRVVVWAVHPDLAVDALERQWRTRLFQTMMPEIDKVMRRP
jgi:hypothetical protein